jgi:sugar phosphate isomerase/epimerase
MNETEPTSKLSSCDRRTFLRVAGSASTLVASSSFGHAVSLHAPSANPILAFVKPFSKMPYDRLAETIAKLGFDGIEATVRSGGQVNPDRVEEELPRLCEALDKAKLRATIMTCGINNLKQPNAEKILTTAAKCGIQYYRPAYYRYDLKRPIADQIAEVRPQLAELAAFNRQHKLTMVYQNHSGPTNFGASLWDLYSVIQDMAPSEIGVALDIAHTTIESGLSWPVECRLMRSHMSALFVKDFRWNERKVQWAPLGQGMVDPRFYSYFRETNFSGPISLHVEYINDNDSDHIEQYIAAFGKDIVKLKELVRNVT